MNEQKIKTPIEMLGDLLAEMTARATEAERQRDEALKRGDEWWQSWSLKDAQLKNTEAELTEEIAAHEKTRERLREARAAIEQEQEAHAELKKKFADYVERLRQEGKCNE